MLNKEQIQTSAVLLAGVFGALLFSTALCYELSFAIQFEQSSSKSPETKRAVEFLEVLGENVIGEEHIYIFTRGFWEDFPSFPGESHGIYGLFSQLVDVTVLMYFVLSLLPVVSLNSKSATGTVFRLPAL